MYRHVEKEEVQVEKRGFLGEEGGGKAHHSLRSGHQGLQQQNGGERRSRGGWKGSSASSSSSSGFIGGAGTGRDVMGAATAHGIVQGGRAGGGSSGRSCAAVRVHTLKPMTELRLVLEENQRDLTVAPPGGDARPTDASTLIRVRR